MSDPRETPFSGRIAHTSLAGRIEAEAFEPGRRQQVRCERTPILNRPGGPRERELVFGESFLELDRQDSQGAGWTYGFAERDGYCGWVASGALAPEATATHVVSVRETYAKATPSVTVTEQVHPLSFGARVQVVGTEGAWARIAWPDGAARHLPARHLRALGEVWDDPVSVAELFIGTPYLWGGNSGRGIDCSGLVQVAMLACGIACPGDSDQQAARLGEAIAAETPVRRGDLFFWTGHVAMAADADTLIHASGHQMMVAREDLRSAVARIAAAEGRPVALRRRVTSPRG